MVQATRALTPLEMRVATIIVAFSMLAGGGGTAYNAYAARDSTRDVAVAMEALRGDIRSIGGTLGKMEESMMRAEAGTDALRSRVSAIETKLAVLEQSSASLSDDTKRSIEGIRQTLAELRSQLR